jgi:hypothetical protein
MCAVAMGPFLGLQVLLWGVVQLVTCWLFIGWLFSIWWGILIFQTANSADIQVL